MSTPELARVQAFADAYNDTDWIAQAGEHELLHSDLVDALAATQKELKELRKRDARLDAMEAAGVDNWDGMGEVEWPDEDETEA